MVGLFLLAGAAEGMGRGMVEEARARREAVLEELRHSRAMALEDRRDAREDRRFERGLAAQREDREADRAFTLDRDERQHQRSLETGGQIVTGSDGTLTRIQGNQASPVVGADGQPFRSGGGAGLTAEENRLVERLQQQHSNDITGAFDREAFRTDLRRAAPSIYQKLYGAPEASAGGAAAVGGEAAGDPAPRQTTSRQDGSSRNRAIPMSAGMSFEDGKFYVNAQGRVAQWSEADGGFVEAGGSANPVERERERQEMSARDERRAATDQRRNARQASLDDQYRELLRRHGTDHTRRVQLTPEMVDQMSAEDVREEAQRLIARSNDARRVWNEIQGGGAQ